MIRPLAWLMLIPVVLAGCATAPSDCSIALRHGWVRMESPPDFVDASTYSEISAARAAPVLPERTSWYEDGSGRFAACEAGDRYGCGETTWYFTGDELEDESEIVLCSGS